MGCFDTVYLDCPACGEIVVEQTKWGECNLSRYRLSDAPLVLVAAMNDCGERGKLYCEHCGVQFKVEVKFIARTVQADGEAPEDEYRTV